MIDKFPKTNYYFKHFRELIAVLRNHLKSRSFSSLVRVLGLLTIFSGSLFYASVHAETTTPNQTVQTTDPEPATQQSSEPARQQSSDIDVVEPRTRKSRSFPSPTPINPSYLPIDRLNFRQSEKVNKVENDQKDFHYRELIVEKIERKDLWPIGEFKEPRKAMTNVMVINARLPKDQIHTPSFYHSIEAALVKKLHQRGGFVFQECVVNCEDKTKILITDDRLTIRRTETTNDFIKEQKKQKNLDGILKWHFIPQENEAILDVRLVSLNNQVLWQDYISAQKDEEIDADDKDASKYNFHLSFNFKSQQVDFVDTEKNTVAESNTLWLLNYGIKGNIDTFENMRYYVGTRFQLNATNLEQFAYYNASVDARIGYSFYGGEEHDVFVIYGAFFQDLFLPGLSSGVVFEWSLSKDYFLGFGYEVPVSNKRILPNKQSIEYTLGEGTWLEVGVKF